MATSLEALLSHPSPYLALVRRASACIAEDEDHNSIEVG
jgi:hypothetical protein